MPHKGQKFEERLHSTMKQGERIPMTARRRKGFKRTPQARTLRNIMEHDFPREHGRESTNEEFKSMDEKARRVMRRKDQLFN